MLLEAVGQVVLDAEPGLRVEGFGKRLASGGVVYRMPLARSLHKVFIALP